MNAPTRSPGRLRRLAARLRERLVRAARWLVHPERVSGPLRLSPRAVRALLLLTVANLLVLLLLGLALYRTGSLLLTQPPVVTVVATPTPGAGPTPGLTATPFGSGGVVAFTLRQDGNTDVYAINQASREVVRLTSDPAQDRDPAWSPDGQMLAFASQRGGNWDVYLLDLEGGALIRLTRDAGFDAGPAWSPDGQHIAFEAYRNGNLDIYMMDSDGRNVERLTSDPAPDYGPAWSPDGRSIAFVSFREGNQDVFLYVLEGELAGLEVNVTQSLNADEADPAWSPDGQTLAYTIGRAGYSTVQLSVLEWRTDETAERPVQLSSTDLFGSGASPTWAPDGQGLITVYRRGARSYLIASSLYGWGLAQEVYSTEALLGSPEWGATPLSAQAIVRARAAAPSSDPVLYTEFVQATPAAGPPYRLTLLADVVEDDGPAQLSDRVDDSFAALRQRVRQETGWDYLALIESAWRPPDAAPRPGQAQANWHVCGRAVDLNQEWYDRDDPLVRVVREDVGNETFWRVFVRAARQDGSFGEPLRTAPWDLAARDEGGTPLVQGGRLLERVLPGYWVDLTTLAADYGWERSPALYRWRQYWPDIVWWHLEKVSGLTLWQCLLELYKPQEIEETFGSLPEP